MILTESRLKQIIAEEIDNLLSEEQLDEAVPKWLRNLGAAAGLTAAGYFGGQATGDQGIPRDTGTIVAKDDSNAATTHRPRPKPDDDSKKTLSKPKKNINKTGNLKKDDFEKAIKSAEAAKPYDEIQQKLKTLKLNDDVKTLAWDIYNQASDKNAMKELIKIAGNNNELFLKGLSSDFSKKIDRVLKKRLYKLLNDYNTAGVPW